MKTISRMAPVSLCVGLAALAVQTANARTPTPTATATPMPPATATPSPPQPAVFTGHVWVNARIVDDADVTAKIEDTVCGTSHAVVSTSGAILFALSVPAQEVLPGCGLEGATISFFVGGQQAPQAAVWHAGEQQFLNPIIGPPFARFGVGLPINRTSRGESVIPFIGNQACGYDMYDVIVYSAEQQAGCGVEGSEVTFKLLDAQGNVTGVANQKGVWHAWDGVSDPQKLNLTFTAGGGITMPSTGTGDGSDGEGNAWGQLSLPLGFVGLASAALGLALRRQAMTR